MDERQLVAMDIGTSKIALTVAKVAGDNVQIIYYRETPSAGIRYSRVINPSKASGAIRQAIGTAEEELGIRITDVIVGLPKYDVQQNTAPLDVKRDAETCISQEEINEIKESALTTYPLSNKDSEILFGAVAQSFGDEDNIQISENDIIGMAPEKLTCNFKVFIGQKKYVKDMRLAFHNAGNLHIRREYFTPDAIAKAVRAVHAGIIDGQLPVAVGVQAHVAAHRVVGVDDVGHAAVLGDPEVVKVEFRTGGSEGDGVAVQAQIAAQKLHGKAAVGFAVAAQHKLHLLRQHVLGQMDGELDLSPSGDGAEGLLKNGHPAVIDTKIHTFIPFCEEQDEKNPAGQSRRMAAVLPQRKFV